MTEPRERAQRAKHAVTRAVRAGIAALVAIAVWRSGTLSRWSGIPFALGFVLYLPQFFGTQPIRVAHGLLVALGCIWVAVSLVTGQSPRPPLLRRQTPKLGKQMADKDAHQISV